MTSKDNSNAAVPDSHQGHIQESNDQLQFANVNDDELLCDDVLPYGWYRFLAYGMYVYSLSEFIYIPIYKKFQIYYILTNDILISHT